MSNTEPCNESSDLLLHWKNRWDDNRLGWHLEEANPKLVQYFSSILLEEERSSSGGWRVLVPLCGKTVDMAYLAKHESVSHVVGVDGIQKALDEFSKEHPELNITGKSTKDDENTTTTATTTSFPFDTLTGDGISLLKGNFSELEVGHLGDDDDDDKFDFVWDRGSIVAVAPEHRVDHVSTIMKVVKPGGVILVSTVDRREGTTKGRSHGPPFSVPHGELGELFKPYASTIQTLELLEEYDEISADPVGSQKFVDQGLTSFYQVITKVTLKRT